MTTTARVEWHREVEGHFLHVRPETAVTGMGDHLVRILIHFHEDGPTTCDCRSVHVQSGNSHDFDPELCETVLRDAGWKVTGPWSRRRACMTAPVAAC
ncbi:hypothetical protein RM572_22070 [Streptomyces sp. DSM 42041]|uniref:Uncharacterized protein n=1 Tax=Streptomyces hazeniae TaxID=3075538 RepID=A0ABU2NWS1_9ACTN|nr:hypothetical protein [Streptomyces sp. DSM 42041]MDT0381450.1 hypothetical protein [Streptomyces sp. DSM 42041]